MRNSQKMSIADLFAAFGGNAGFARAIGVGASTASEMKRRGRIPAEYWHDLLRHARTAGHPEITADLLAELHARKPEPETPTGFAEEESLPIKASADMGTTEAPETGHFARFKHLRRSHFSSSEEISAHVRAVRDEWDRR